MNSAFQDEILSMSNFRYKLINQLHQFGDNDPHEKEVNDQIDELTNEILKYIKLYYEQLPFEFIMEELSKLGQCPNLLNDDNGKWAVTSDGFQNVVYGDEPSDVETSFFVEAKDWKLTPREALLHYLNEE